MEVANMKKKKIFGVSKKEYNRRLKSKLGSMYGKTGVGLAKDIIIKKDKEEKGVIEWIIKWILKP